MFEKRYKDCRLVVKGYETYYHDGEGYSYSTDGAISVFKGSEYSGGGIKVTILGLGFSKIKVKIEYKGKTTIHDMKKGDGILVDSRDDSHGTNEFAHIDQKELYVRLVTL